MLNHEHGYLADAQTKERAALCLVLLGLNAEAEAEAIRLKGEILAQYPEIIQLEFVNSLKDPDSNVSWGIMPQEGVIPFLNVTP